ncbi:MAG TPA: alanine--tRNA ligase-related protein, partial [Nitrospiraceae bacterium]
MKNSAQHLRQSFIRYFQQQGHEAVPSSALIPQADPTLLFTNAGMNQF